MRTWDNPLQGEGKYNQYGEILTLDLDQTKDDK